MDTACGRTQRRVKQVGRFAMQVSANVRGDFRRRPTISVDAPGGDIDRRTVSVWRGGVGYSLAIVTVRRRRLKFKTVC
jgi:hypothetical protein